MLPRSLNGRRYDNRSGFIAGSYDPEHEIGAALLYGQDAQHVLLLQMKLHLQGRIVLMKNRYRPGVANLDGNGNGVHRTCSLDEATPLPGLGILRMVSYTIQKAPATRFGSRSSETP